MLLIHFTSPTQTTVKYFPFDENVVFEKSETELTLLDNKNEHYIVRWISDSKTNNTIYLRQDLSLLYVDGLLKGLQSKWRENESDISLESDIHGEGSSYYQSITYHHGEVHYKNNSIKSLNRMSYDEMYVIDSEHSSLFTFRKPKEEQQIEWKDTLDHTISQQLHYHWHNLINHFQLNYDDFLFVPLTELYQFETRNLPNLDKNQTRKVIAQLWEGLYANYILPFQETETIQKSYIPLILFSKTGDRLYVLFQDQHGEMRQLIQTYSINN